MRRVIIALFILLSLLVSCSCGGPDAGGGVWAGGDDEEWLFDDEAEYDEPDDGKSRIVEALENEEITEDEYLLLRFQEAYEPESLPEEYQSEDETTAVDETFLFYMLNHRWDELDSATQAALEQYHLPGWDPGSYWYDPEMENDETLMGTFGEESELAGTVEKTIDWLTIVPAVEAVQNKHPSGTDYMIRFQTGYNAQALIVKAAMDKAYAKFKAAGFKEPKDWIWVRLQDISDGSLGVEELDNIMNDGVQRCTIRIERDLSKKRMESVTAHELFHCFQEYMDLMPYSSEEWIWESTAVWSEEFVYPENNREHEYDSDIFPKLNAWFFDRQGVRHYGAYIWWYYLYQEAGKSHVPIKSMLEAAKKPNGQLKAHKARPKFYEEHKEWALWNLNMEAFYKFYKDHANMPTYIPQPPSLDKSRLYNDITMPQDLAVDAGGMHYYTYRVNNDVDKVKIKLEGANKKVHEQLGVQLLYKIDDNWLYLDVSEEDEVVFCRKRASERVKFLILIFNNADLDDMFFSQFEVDGTDKCAPEWSGYTRVTWTDAGSANDLPTLSGDPTSGNWHERGSLTIRDTLVYDSENDEFLIKKTHYSYSHSEKQTITYSRDCGLQHEIDYDSYQGAGSKEWEIDPGKLWQSNAPTRLENSGEGPGVYELDLDPAVGTFTSYSFKIDQQKTCPFWGIATPVGAELQRQEWHDTHNSEEETVFGPDPNMYEYRVQLSEDRKRLTGRGEANFVYDGREVPVYIDVDYSYG